MASVVTINLLTGLLIIAVIFMAYSGEHIIHGYDRHLIEYQRFHRE